MADLKSLSAASGLDFSQLLDQVRRCQAAPARATKEQVASYVTSDGVALCTIAAIYKGSQLLTVSINSSARLARSITVSPPPASKTIPYSKISGG